MWFSSCDYTSKQNIDKGNLQDENQKSGTNYINCVGKLSIKI